MVSKTDLAIKEMLNRISDEYIEQIYTEIYKDCDDRFQIIFGHFHSNFNSLFGFMNSKAKYNNHFNAEESRELIWLIGSFEELYTALKDTELQFDINETYKKAINMCQEFLSPSEGSTIPDNFEIIKIIKYEPIFFFDKNIIARSLETRNLKLSMKGSGSFCNVYKYKDPFYNTFFALKRAKKTSTEREITRLKQEFRIMKNLNYPYVLKVYEYDANKNSYTMEYCDYTLDEYIAKNNNNPKLTFQYRKGIATQFLKGLEYVHKEGYLHRDLSYKNILVQTYDNDLVIIKLSDFGLVKDPSSDFTKTDTARKGTIIDPCLGRFKDYNIQNEIYSVGFILQYIFTGKKQLMYDNNTDVGLIVQKCTNLDLSQRFKDLDSIKRTLVESKN